jgi:hypothetical protein
MKIPFLLSLLLLLAGGGAQQSAVTITLVRWPFT